MIDETLKVGYPFRAVMGYKSLEPGFALRVCCACPDAKQATNWAAPLPVSHGYCEACATRIREELLGEKIEA